MTRPVNRDAGTGCAANIVVGGAINSAHRIVHLGTGAERLWAGHTADPDMLHQYAGALCLATVGVGHAILTAHREEPFEAEAGGARDTGAAVHNLHVGAAGGTRVRIVAAVAAAHWRVNGRAD